MSAPDRIERATPPSTAEVPPTDGDALLVERLLGAAASADGTSARQLDLAEALERALMKSADTAMYTAKQAGRSAYRLFSSTLTAERRERTRETAPRFEHSDPIF